MLNNSIGEKQPNLTNRAMSTRAMSELEVTSVVKSLNNPTLSNPLVNMLNVKYSF